MTVLHADSREALKTLADNSLDSCVCDPPYALVSINKRFAKTGRTESTMPTAGPYARASSGFMGVKWDTGETAFDPEFWAEVLRVLKPGAHVVAFSGTRTYHRMACAIEDAGFEIRDQLAWAYGSGFPKSHDVAKGIDKAQGQSGTVAAKGKPVRRIRPGADQNKDGSWKKLEGRVYQPGQYVPATPEAAAWEGWGTALKPAWEPICLARKPLDGTVAANVLKWGTGALNIGGCRVAAASGDEPFKWSSPRGGIWRTDSQAQGQPQAQDAGRWPANIIHDGSDEVIAAFPETDPGGGPAIGAARTKQVTYGEPSVNLSAPLGSNSGSAARFFYAAKAGPYDRFASKHPTVKPVELMRWLCRLVTPPGGTVLDPFAGSGTTGAAAMIEGFPFLLIEREAEYVADIRRRLAWMKGDGPLTEQVMSKATQADDGPLFGSAA